MKISKANNLGQNIKHVRKRVGEWADIIIPTIVVIAIVAAITVLSVVTAPDKDAREASASRAYFDGRFEMIAYNSSLDAMILRDTADGAEYWYQWGSYSSTPTMMPLSGRNSDGEG